MSGSQWVLRNESSAIGHFPHIKTRSHLNSEVNVWRGPLVLALETDREHETANRFLVKYFFGTKFGEGATRVLFWNKIWRRVGGSRCYTICREDSLVARG